MYVCMYVCVSRTAAQEPLYYVETQVESLKVGDWLDRIVAGLNFLWCQLGVPDWQKPVFMPILLAWA